MRPALLIAFLGVTASAPASAQVAATTVPAPEPAAVPMPAQPVAAVAPVAAGAPTAVAPMTFAYADVDVPNAWSSPDPADSLYRVAREALNRSEYRRAAQLFRQVRERHPRSTYVSEAAYWEAFSLYRVGTQDDLRAALRVLDEQASYSRKETESSAHALRARVLGALARRGDRSAEVRLANAARSGAATCDSEDMMVRAEALNALSQLDQAAAMPLLRRVLEKRDECSVSLRRTAVTLAARRGGESSLPLLADVATKDPSSSVRSSAAANIARMDGAAASAALESMLRSPDDNVRKTAALALVRRPEPRARAAFRGYLESSQTPDAHRAEAIQNIHKEHAAPDDAGWLRGFYARPATTDRVRYAIINVLPRLAPEESRGWLLGIARDPNQPTQVRAAAIQVLSRDQQLPVGDLAQMYDAASERRIREQVVMALGRRDEPAATDKLIQIARTGTDPVVRSAAIAQLSKKKEDPRVTAFLQELIG